MADDRLQNTPPPSSVEVSIRTMVSDLAAMGHATGGVSMPETVRVESKVEVDAAASAVAASSKGARAYSAFSNARNAQIQASRERINANVAADETRFNWKPILWIALAAIGATLLFFLGFYVAPKIFS